MRVASSFQIMFGVLFQPHRTPLPILPLHMFLTCSSCCCFFSISCNDICLQPHTTPFDASLLPVSCPQKSNSLFWFRFEFLTVLPFLHQTTKTGCMLQRSVHLLCFRVGLCWHGSAPLLFHPTPFLLLPACLPSRCLQ